MGTVHYLDAAPQSIEDNLRKMFPGTLAVTWERDQEGNYQALLEWDSKFTLVLFDAQGTWTSSVFFINPAQLPDWIKARIRDECEDAFILYAQQIFLADGEMQYQVEVDSFETDNPIRWTFLADGTVIHRMELISHHFFVGMN